MADEMKQLTLFEREKQNGLAAIIDPLNKRIAKVHKDIERQGSYGVAWWKIREYYDLHGHPPQGNETYE